jgi:CAAX protease family protein
MRTSRATRPQAAALLLAAIMLAALVLAAGAGGARAGTPEWTGLASLLLPGAGQAVNGDYAAGATQAVLYGVLVNQYLKRLERPDYIAADRREDDVTHVVHTNRTTAVTDMYGSAALDLAFYSSFGAYRDARAKPEYQAGYDTPAPQESLSDLALAPFQWDWLRRPTTLAPLLVPLYLALAPVPADRLVLAPDASIERRELAARFFFQHEGVAVGEEAFFRGYLNTTFGEAFGPYWGLAASSTAFGLAHSGTGVQATSLGAAVFGAYLGWLQIGNDYAIGQGVAIHFWWNFLTSMALLRQHSGATVTPISLTVRF